ATFSFNTPAPTLPDSSSLHDALPISTPVVVAQEFEPTEQGMNAEQGVGPEQGLADVFDGLLNDSDNPDGGETSEDAPASSTRERSEEHTSELQSRFDLVCRLLLENKK